MKINTLVMIGVALSIGNNVYAGYNLPRDSSTFGLSDSTVQELTQVFPTVSKDKSYDRLNIILNRDIPKQFQENCKTVKEKWFGRYGPKSSASTRVLALAEDKKLGEVQLAISLDCLSDSRYGILVLQKKDSKIYLLDEDPGSDYTVVGVKSATFVDLMSGLGLFVNYTKSDNNPCCGGGMQHESQWKALYQVHPMNQRPIIKVSLFNLTVFGDDTEQGVADDEKYVGESIEKKNSEGKIVSIETSFKVTKNGKFVKSGKTSLLRWDQKSKEYTAPSDQ